jgi:hypothetical protein
MKLPYREGTWFGVPLENGGYAVGVVARATKAGPIILCYFFGPRRLSLPTVTELEHLQTKDALKVLRVGDLGLTNKSWPIIGVATSWNRTDWPMPVFLRTEYLTSRVWRVYYSDDDPLEIVKEERETSGDSTLIRNSTFGYVAAELVLDHVLS